MLWPNERHLTIRAIPDFIETVFITPAHASITRQEGHWVDKDQAPVRTRVTISEVAKAAGVSKATVSRYMGEDRQLLAEATAARIAAVVERLGYRPNRMASALKRGRTGLIGMLLADIRNPYSVAVMHGVETACRQQGYSLVVCNTDCDDDQERTPPAGPAGLQRRWLDREHPWSSGRRAGRFGP